MELSGPVVRLTKTSRRGILLFVPQSRKQAPSHGQSHIDESHTPEGTPVWKVVSVFVPFDVNTSELKKKAKFSCDPNLKYLI